MIKFQNLEKFWTLTKFKRKELYLVFVFMIIAALVDVLSISALIPVINSLVIGETNFF